MQEIFRCAHDSKRQYLIDPFLISNVCCKHDHFWRSFLSSPLFLSHLTTAVVCFCQWQQVYDRISNLRLYYVESGTQHHNKVIFWALCVAESVLVWMCHLAFSLCLAATKMYWDGFLYLFLRTSKPKIKLLKGVQYGTFKEREIWFQKRERV